MLSESALQSILQVCQADSIASIESVQTLWSGYGEIARVRLRGGPMESVIVKGVSPPTIAQQPRGWNTDHSHQRKLRSYQVESHWYQHAAHRLNDSCRVADCYLAESNGDHHLFVLEDLDAAGFDQRHTTLGPSGVRAGLHWLANFHAVFLNGSVFGRKSLGQPIEGLWPVGTYWHLETRPEEFAAMPDASPLKKRAHVIDQKLNQCRFSTLVHGDAKVANFCFALDGEKIAAVDFQYVGGGCGMKDVAYFLGSCLSEDQCERDGESYLDDYFMRLREAMGESDPLAPNRIAVALDQLESEWRGLYPLAWADFHRFLIGWCPGHPKLHGYTRRMTEQALEMSRP